MWNSDIILLGLMVVPFPMKVFQGNKKDGGKRMVLSLEQNLPVSTKQAQIIKSLLFIILEGSGKGEQFSRH